MVNKILLLVILSFTSNLFAQEITVLPYKVVANKMIVDMRLNGRKASFIFDTGGRNSINTDFRTELGLLTGKTITVTDANSNQMQTNIVNIDKVQDLYGKSIFNNTSFLLLDNELFTCLNVVGFIGSDLFQNHTIEIDDRAKVIKLRTGGMPGIFSDRRAISFTDDANGAPVIMVNVGAYDEAKILFDTGSDRFFTLKQDDFSRLKQTNALHVIKEGIGKGSIGVAGRSTVAKRILANVNEIMIGKTNFINFSANVTMTPSNLLGYQSLKYGNVTIDYVNKMLRFEPLEPGPIEVEKKKIWDLELQVDGNQIVVATIWDIVKGQVEIGDLVTHINGQKLKPISLCESITSGLLQLQQNDEVVLTIKTKDGVKNICIKKS